MCWRIEGQRGKRRPRGPPQPRKGGQPTGARPRRTAKPGAETSPDLPAAQEQAGDPAAGGESARRNCAAGGTWRTAPATRTPPRGLPGRRTATKERTPAPTATGPLAGQISVLSRRSTQVAVCCGAADAATQMRRQWATQTGSASRLSARNGTAAKSAANTLARTQRLRRPRFLCRGVNRVARKAIFGGDAAG